MTHDEQLRQDLKKCFEIFNYEFMSGEEEVDALMKIVIRERQKAVEDAFMQYEKKLQEVSRDMMIYTTLTDKSKQSILEAMFPNPDVPTL